MESFLRSKPSWSISETDEKETPIKLGLLTVSENLLRIVIAMREVEKFISNPNAFRLDLGVRRGSVLSRILFAVYFDDLSNIIMFTS